LKQALFRRAVAENNHDWAASLQATVDGMNETVHSKLGGRVPEEVEVDDVLQFHLREQASEDLMRNHRIIEARGHKLQKQGAFRPADSKRQFQRSFQPKFNNEVHETAEIKGGNVIDEHGQSYATKRVLAVPIGSQHIAPGASTGMRGGSLLTENIRKASLKPFAHQLEEYLGLDTIGMATVITKMKHMGMARLMIRGLNYKLALELLGFTVQKAAKNSFNVIGKRARTPATKPQRASTIANAPRAAPVTVAVMDPQPVRPRRQAFLKAQQFLHAHAADM
jgi:hypothetical protein